MKTICNFINWYYMVLIKELKEIGINFKSSAISTETDFLE